MCYRHGSCYYHTMEASTVKSEALSRAWDWSARESGSP